MIQGTMWQEIDGFRREMENIFNGLTSTANGPSPFVKIFSDPADYNPTLNLREDEEAVFVEAIIPGVDPESLDLSVERNALTLSGTKSPFGQENDTDVFRRQERSSGTFTRKLNLPSEVDPEQVQADYNHGVLVVTLPKAAKDKPKKIEIKSV